MIPISKYLPKQLNGYVLEAYAEALKQEIEKTEFVIDYLANLSIATANDTEAENIGRIIGYLRPIVPVGFDEDNVFLFGTLPMSVESEIGMGNAGTDTGGRLSTTELSDSNYMALDMYRRVLKAMAIIKRNGITLYSIDMIAASVSNDYDIEYDEDNDDGDITIIFNDGVGYKTVWFLSQIFLRIATEPQITIISGA